MESYVFLTVGPGCCLRRLGAEQAREVILFSIVSGEAGERFAQPLGFRDNQGSCAIPAQANTSKLERVLV